MLLARLKETGQPHLVKNGAEEQGSHVAYTLEGCEIQIKGAYLLIDVKRSVCMFLVALATYLAGVGSEGVDQRY